MNAALQAAQGKRVHVAFLAIVPEVGTNVGDLWGTLGFSLDENDQLAELVIQETEGSATFIDPRRVLRLELA